MFFFLESDMLDRLKAFFSSLPPAARVGIPALLVLFVLAVVVGLATRQGATPATVSTVRPAAAPAAVSAASPALAPAPGVAPAAPPAPQMGAAATGATVMRPAMTPQALRGCAREVLGLPQNNTSDLSGAAFTAAAEREDCKSPFATGSARLHEDFTAYAPGRGDLQITRSGIYRAERAGEHVFMLASPEGGRRRCALYVGDLTAPLVEADKWSGQFAVPAVAALEAGQHEVALVCGFTIRNTMSGGGDSVTASVRGPGETTPSLLKLNLPDTAVPAGGAAGAGGVK